MIATAFREADRCETEYFFPLESVDTIFERNEALIILFCNIYGEKIHPSAQPPLAIDIVVLVLFGGMPVELAAFFQQETNEEIDEKGFLTTLFRLVSSIGVEWEEGWLITAETKVQPTEG